MYYFTSDMHLGHKNILHLCNRPFANITEHDQTIIKWHNAVVSDSDEIYDLGDVGYRCSPFYVAECLKKMNGKRIVLLGNHDKPFRQACKKGLLKDLINKGKLEIIGGETSINDHSLYMSKMIEIEGQRVFIGHIASRTWPNAFRGAWHLYGHSHGNLSEPFYRSFDIGVDKHNFCPWSWIEIKDAMAKISNNFQED